MPSHGQRRLAAGVRLEGCGPAGARGRCISLPATADRYLATVTVGVAGMKSASWLAARRRRPATGPTRRPAEYGSHNGVHRGLHRRRGFRNRSQLVFRGHATAVWRSCSLHRAPDLEPVRIPGRLVPPVVDDRDIQLPREKPVAGLKPAYRHRRGRIRQDAGNGTRTAANKSCSRQRLQTHEIECHQTTCASAGTVATRPPSCGGTGRAT